MQDELFGVPEPTDLELEGDGPFVLPLCTALEMKDLGAFTALRFKTVCDRHVIVMLAGEAVDVKTKMQVLSEPAVSHEPHKTHQASKEVPVLARILERLIPGRLINHPIFGQASADRRPSHASTTRPHTAMAGSTRR